jgi:hypothetical protein
MIVKYEIKLYGSDRIVTINCVKETEKTLWIETEWNKRKSIHQRRKCSDLHDTWQSAYAELIRRAHAEIGGAQNRLRRAESDLAEIKALTEPKP